MAKDVTLEEEIKELERELNTRKRVYPEWSKGPTPKLKPEEADRRIRCIEASIRRLKAIQRQVVGEQKSIF